MRMAIPEDDLPRLAKFQPTTSQNTKPSQKFLSRSKWVFARKKTCGASSLLYRIEWACHAPKFELADNTFKECCD